MTVWEPSDDADVLARKLETSLEGLTSEESESRLKKYGKNELCSKESRGRVQIFIAQFKNALVFLLIGASIVSYLLGEVTDSIIIASIVILNSLLGFYQEYQSEKTLENLSKLVTLKARVRRGNSIVEVDSRMLVPGDLVFLEQGEVAPADIRLIQADEVTVDESALTGEAFPVKKEHYSLNTDSRDVNDLTNLVFMSTYIKSGKGHGYVVNTGRQTFIGNTAVLLKEIERKSSFQQRMEEFSGILLKIVLVSIFVVVVLKTVFGSALPETILFALALAVGMVPEALPIVVTISLSNGAMLLAKKKVVVKRLVSVEDLGNVDVLCTDKTGTITENRITLEEYSCLGGAPDELVLKYAYMGTRISEGSEGSPIDRAIIDHVEKNVTDVSGFTVINEIPFNSNRKRNSVLVEIENRRLLIVKGAPEYILDLSKNMYSVGQTAPIEDRDKLLDVYREYGQRGLRTIAVAFKEYGSESYTGDEENELTLIGFIGFIDPPKESAIEAFRKSRELFIDVKILTGDGPYVTREIARQVGIHLEDNQIILGSEVDQLSDEELEKRMNEIVVMCRSTPEQKFRIIKTLGKMGRVTACMGDGVNDAPALKEAHVGIAVDQGTDIAKDAADIILLEKDLRVVMDGIEEGRKTFSNIVKYIIYTIAGNFGDLYTVAAASLVMTFLPLLPSQLILSNFLTDTPVISVSTDNVEDE
ncbi:MAG: HAD-IC family P-type ATPase, partial [Candidatus Bathyarchaeota archaeon]